MQEVTETKQADTNTEVKEGREITASKEEQIGFHKGSLSTLAKEREELVKIVSIVEQLMHVHVEALKNLGVDLEEMAKNAAAQADKKGVKDNTPKNNKPLEDSL